MSSTVGLSGVDLSGGPTPVRQADRRRTTLEELRAELTTGRFATTRPVLPGLSALFPGGGLRRGAAYVVSGSTALGLALAVETSRSGGWCGVVGMPDLGVEAAAALGLELRRLVLVPTPGASWMSVVGTLADALDVLIVRPPRAGGSLPSQSGPGRSRHAGPPPRSRHAGPRPPRAGEVRRLAARLRERGTTLIVDLPRAVEWPGAEMRLEITASTWHGLGAGHGQLRAREVTVAATGRATGGRPRTTGLWLPDRDGRVRSHDPLAAREVVRELAEHRLRRAG